MMNVTKQLMKAPIPGEHLTKNSKNKPWHSPPKYAKFDDALEYFFDEVIPQKEFLPSIITLAESNVPITGVVSAMLLGHSSKGRFTPDMALKLAGPVYKLVTRALDAVEVDYLTGFESAEETQAKISGKGAPKAGKKLSKAQESEMERITEETKVEIPEGGLMGAPVEGEETMDIPPADDMPSLMEEDK